MRTAAGLSPPHCGAVSTTTPSHPAHPTMPGHSDTRLTALAAEIRQQLDGAYPHLPPTVFSALVRELAWVTLRWEYGEHPTPTEYMPAVQRERRMVVVGERIT